MDSRAVHNYFDFDISVERNGEAINTFKIHECNETDAEMWWHFNFRMSRDFKDNSDPTVRRPKYLCIEDP